MHSGTHATFNIIILIVVAALVVFRNLRPQRMTASRFWLFPIMLVLLTGVVLWTSVEQAPGSVWITVIATLIGLVLGVPYGMARGHHSQVTLTKEPGVFLIQPSVAVMIIWLCAFIVKFLVRDYMPHAGAVGMAGSDGFLFFAIISVLVSRYMIFRKYEALAAARTP